MRFEKIIVVASLIFLVSCYGTRMQQNPLKEKLTIAQKIPGIEVLHNVAPAVPSGRANAPSYLFGFTTPTKDLKGLLTENGSLEKINQIGSTKVAAADLKSEESTDLPNASSSRNQPVMSVQNTKDSEFLIFTGIVTLLSSALLFPFMSKMKKISWYALQNRRKTRWIIGAIHLALGFPAFFLGKYLCDMGITTTDTTTFTLLGFTAASVMFFPKRKSVKGLFKNTYLKQKMFSMLLALSGLSLLVNLGNRTAADHNFSKPAAFVLSHAESYLPITDMSANTGDGETGEKVFLTIIAVLLFAVALALLAAFSCSLSCSGQEAAASLVAIGGGALAIFLLVLALRGIWRVNSTSSPAKP